MTIKKTWKLHKIIVGKILKAVLEINQYETRIAYDGHVC
jgi:hypothetical protein